jgi:hypothetical protein
VRHLTRVASADDIAVDAANVSPAVLDDVDERVRHHTVVVSAPTPP